VVNCISDKRQTLSHPVDTKSLYANRVYDNQTANRRCYNYNPVDIIEGFGLGNMDMKAILKWGILFLIVCAILMMVMDGGMKKEIKLGVSTPTPASSDFASKL
jgi:hypothetical protein